MAAWMRLMLAISGPMSFGLFSSPPHRARRHRVDDDQTGLAAVALRQILERGDDVGGDLRVAEIERPAHHLERQLALQQAMFDAPSDGAACDHGGAFERHIEHRTLLDLAAVPDAAGRNVQAEILDADRLAAARLAVPDGNFTDGEQMMHEPDLAAARAQVGEFGAGKDAPVVLRLVVGFLVRRRLGCALALRLGEASSTASTSSGVSAGITSPSDVCGWRRVRRCCAR